MRTAEGARVPGSSDGPPNRETLARRLELLLDVVRIENGARAPFKEIEAFVESRGLHLSRARWYYMLTGERSEVTDRPLLEAIAEFFQVPASYLTERSGDLPERVQAQLELLQTVRENNIRVYMARQLGELNPTRLRELNDLLGQDDLLPDDSSDA